jgi:hypothetical protein
MKSILRGSIASCIVIFSIGQASAGIYSSEQAISSQQFQYNKNQVLTLMNSVEVQQKLIDLGVSPADAKMRINIMTNDELVTFNQQMNDMPAGGIVGTVVTLLVVVAVLDLMGITDVYPFIRPI